MWSLPCWNAESSRNLSVYINARDPWGKEGVTYIEGRGRTEVALAELKGECSSGGEEREGTGKG